MPDTPYFTVAEMRGATYLGAQSPLANASKYPDADINAMRGAVEEALEHACGVAFVPRTATVRLDGPGGVDLLLPNVRPSAVTAVSVNGAALDSSALAALVLYTDGRVYNPAGWSSGRGNISMTYTHGYATIPGRVKRAAVLLTKRFLVDSPVNDRATSLVNEDGTTQFFVTAGVKSAITDVPEANAVIEQYGVEIGVA